MNREETISVLTVLRQSYPGFYTKLSNRDLNGIVDLWGEMFKDDNPVLVAAAVKSLIVSSTSSYPPNIGQVKEKMRFLLDDGSDNEGEAWAKVSAAIRRSGWSSKEEFDKLPENIQRIVGSPHQLYEWSQMDSDVVHSVVASNFQRAFRARAAHDKQYAALPSDVKQVLKEIGGHMRMESSEEYQQRIENNRQKMIAAMKAEIKGEE